MKNAKKTIQIFAIKFSIAISAIVSCSFLGRACFAQDSVADVIESKQLISLEFSDLSKIVKQIKNTSFGSNSRWADIRNYVTHTKFGWVDESSLEKIENKFIEVMDLLGPKEAICSVSRSDLSWQITIRCGSENLDKDLADIVDDLMRFRFSAPNADEEISIEIETAESVDDIKIFQVGSVFVFAHEQYLSFASSQGRCKMIARRMSGTDTKFRPLSKSRKYLRIKSHMKNASVNGEQIYAYIDPDVLMQLTDLVDAKTKHLWGLGGLLGSGISINLVPSQREDLDENEERVELVLDAYLMLANPREGASELVKLAGTPSEFPTLPEDVSALFFSNLDWRFFEDKAAELFEEVNGEGSYLAFNKNRFGPIAKLLDEQFYENRLKAMGSFYGVCFFERNEVPSTMTFKDSDDIEAAFDEIKTKFRAIQKVSPKSKLTEETIDGYDSLMQSTKFPKLGRFGYLCIDDWIIQSDEKTLEALVGNGFSSRLPDKIENLIECLHKHSTVSKERSVLLAVLPTGWRVANATLISKKFKDRAYEEALKQFPGDTKETLEEYRRLTQNWEQYDPGDPRSPRDVNDFVQMSVTRIAFESFGNFILIGNDDGDGFRFSGMLSDR